MSFVTISPNMSFNIPVTGVEIGPDWANHLNNSLLIVDSHNHTPGSGVLITPAAMSFDTDLNINQKNLTSVRSVNFTSQPSTLGQPTDKGCIYESGVDLYYNDGSGNSIRMTQSGGVAGTPGSITNLIPPATASYAPVGAKFIWQSAVNTPANMDAASIILRNLVVNSFGLTLAPPLGLPSNYQVTLPMLPGQTNVMTLNPSGTMGSITYDQVGINMSSVGANAIANDITSINPGPANVIASAITSIDADSANVIASAITSIDADSANVIASAITGIDADSANVIANSRTRSTGFSVSTGGVAISNSSGSFTTTSSSDVNVTNLSVTIQTSGRPVSVSLIGTSNASLDAKSSSENAESLFSLYRGVTSLVSYRLQCAADNSAFYGIQVAVPVSALNYLDNIGAGTYTYQVKARAAEGNANVINAILVVYEI